MNNKGSEKATPKSQVPPYMSWKTFLSFIKSLSAGMPDPIHPSMMIGVSGSNKSWIMGTLRFLRLIDEGDHPQTDLESLVHGATAPGNEKEFETILRDLLKDAYPFVFEKGFDLATTSPASFSQKFRDLGVTGETIRKAEVFFLEAAKDAKLTISPYILSARKRGPKGGSPSTTSKTRLKKHGGRKSLAGQNMRQDLVSKFPEFDPNWSPEAQEAWFKLYDRLLNKFEVGEEAEEEETEEGDT